ncbi:hypothetical protein P8452_73849 [Trifolium repens]|nr:ankyrin repeat-containing protein BDA1 [Trifolium repens]WJX92168.1 hypothetical protein P8452_73849 [Trifolium repens]
MSSARLNNLPESRFEKLFQSLKEWFEYKNKDEWLKDMKTSIILAASIIATMTFSLATNPPGGVLQASFDDVNRGCLTSNVTGFSLCVGEAILGYLDRDRYVRFLVCDTICFIAAITVIFLLVSGIPMENTFTIWLLSTCMCVTLTFLALTFIFAAYMVTPNSIWKHYHRNPFTIGLIIWIAIVAIVLSLLIVRLFIRRRNQNL